jgi:hypothetical protein
MTFFDLNSTDFNQKLYINSKKFNGKGIFMIYTETCPYCIQMLSIVNNTKIPIYGYNVSRNTFSREMFKLKSNESGVPMFLPVSSNKKILTSKKKLIGMQTKKDLNNYLKNFL